MARSPASLLESRRLIGAASGVALLVAFASFYRVVLDGSFVAPRAGDPFSAA